MTESNVKFDNKHGENVQMETKSKRSRSQPTISSNQRSFCLFKRSSGNFFNLRYNSNVLEDYYQESSLTYAIYRYKFSCLYLIALSLCWLILAVVRAQPNYVYYTIGFVIAILVFAVLFGLAFAEALFKKCHVWLYVVEGVFILLFNLVTFVSTNEGASTGFSLIFNLFVGMQSILLLYTMVPLRLWQALLISGLLTVAFMCLSLGHYGVGSSGRVAVAILLAHVAFHLVGLLHHLILQARRRSSFLKLGQIAELKLKIKDEQNSKEEMIQSLMPLHVAQEVMASKGAALDDGDGGSGGGGSSGGMGVPGGSNRKLSSDEEYDEDSEDDVVIRRGGGGARGSRPSRQLDSGYRDDDDEDAASNLSALNETSAQVKFRNFHVNQMKDVSILFADIVGFTKMSSNKTAPHLVFLLNDLFGRFDKLCELNGCEKIATLGDCYYCVAGCPQPATDHAERCVEMGRSMCKAIQQFDETHNEEVNMRVGVHTGTVTCGIVGTHRFKFDVWSHDVTLANEMESSGKAERVHISEETYEFVKDVYEVDPGVELSDFRKLNVLTEYFDNQTQSFAIKHVQEKTNIKTFLVIDRFDKKPCKLIEDEDGPVLYDGAAKIKSENKENDTAAEATVPEETEDNALAGDEQKQAMLPIAGNTTGETSVVPVNATGDDVDDLLEERRLNDEDVVRCLKEDPQLMVLFFKPPINYCTLEFNDKKLEHKYRRAGLRRHQASKRRLTWAHNRVSPLLYSLVHSFVSVLLIITCLFCFPPFNSAIQETMRFFFIVLLIIVNLIVLIPLLYDFIKLDAVSTRFVKFYRALFSWLPRHVICPILIGLPVCLVLAHFHPCFFAAPLSSTEKFLGLPGYKVCFGICLLLSLSGLSLFSWFSAWAKLATALFLIIVSSILLIMVRCLGGQVFDLRGCGNFTPNYFNFYYSSYTNLTIPRNELIWLQPATSPRNVLEVELLLSLLMSLAMALFLARELEISRRASFCCEDGAHTARHTIAEERRQADWLLENIIPRYVIDPVKTQKKYSQHMERVGVIFATIANFSEFYDEQYEGGREMLRVLNEIFADFENLLSKSKYDDVEKIKTVGSCFMAASGLNPAKRAVRDKRNPNGHLYALMDFSVDLINTLDAFNQQLFNFDFELKIGYNIGDVTAGVIGTTKLLYDIWGDTVNVASRMYSTGEKGRIQVTEAVKLQLEEKYDFQYRGEVEVKGKGKMKTYQLEGKKKSVKPTEASS